MAGTRLDSFLGRNPKIVEIRNQIERLLERQTDVARRLPPILIEGETGTGKGLLAAAIHQAGPRSRAAFVDVNCAAIPETLLESELFGFERGAFTGAQQAKAGLLQTAHRGTIFLDEIALMPEALQAKLLKAIEDRSVRRLGSTRSEPVDIWIIAAANADLSAAIQARRFREDLYHRLAVVTVHLPPLRERGDDVLTLAEHFLRAACADYGIPLKRLSDDAARSLKAHSWPGNVRELANVMERASLLSDGTVITANDLQNLHIRSAAASPLPSPSASVDDEVAALERRHLEEALQATDWNVSHAAARLGMARNTLRYRMSKHGLIPPSKPARPRSRPSIETAPPAVPAAPTIATRSQKIEWERRRITFVQTSIGAGSAEGPSSDIGRLMEEVLEKARSFGARISEVETARMICVFGIEPSEDPASQAAHMAMTALNVAKRANRASGGNPAVTVAIHTYQCLVGRSGDTAEIDSTARHEAQTVLDALTSVAGAGSIIVSQAAASFVGTRFKLQPTHPASESALLLLGFRDMDPAAPFVGRRRELGFLEERFELTENGQGQLVILVGEAGIGKSRLVREFRRSLGTRVMWTEGRAVSFGQSMPFHPLIDMLRRSFAIEDSDADPEIIRKTEAALEEFGERFRPALPFLQYLLSVLPSDSAVWTMDPKLRRAQIFDALRQFMIGSSDIRPHVVVVEDLHWIDQATAGFLALLVDGIPASRVLVILTCRPGFSAGFQESTFHTRLTLPGLSSSESAQIASALLQSQKLPEDLRTLIDRKAEGNPFFVEEIARSLLETGVVVRNEDGVVLAQALNTIDVPDAIEDVILARIGRLDEDVRRLLQLASVIGREFSRRLLDRLQDNPERTAEILRGLKATEFIHEKPAPEPVCIFKHALIHQVTYASLGEPERREQHRRIGGAIEELYADRLPEHYGVLAHHFLCAEDWAKAIEHLLKAAQQAAQSFATREALNLYDQALAASRRMSDGLRDPSTLIAIHQAKANLFFVTSQFERSKEEAEHILPYARLTGNAVKEAEALAAMSWADTWSRKLDRAIAAANQALAVAEPAGAVAVQARAHFTIGWVHAVTGIADESHAALHKAIRLSQAAGDAVHHSLSLSALGLVENWKGDYERAAKVQTEALSIARERNLLVPLLFNFFLRGLTLTARGDYDEAFLMFQEGLALSQQVGDEAIHHRLLNCLGWLYSEIGDFDRALILNEQSAQIGRRRGDPGSTPNAEINLGEIYLARGDRASAEELFEGVYRYWQDPSTSPWMRFRYSIRLFGDMGELALARRDLEQATAMSNRCLEAASHTESRKNLVKAYRLKGEIAAARREWKEAEHYLGQAIDIARSIGNPPQIWKTHVAFGRLYEESGRRELASKAYSSARGVVDKVQASLQKEDLKASFERAAFVHEIRSLSES